MRFVLVFGGWREGESMTFSARSVDAAVRTSREEVQRKRAQRLGPVSAVLYRKVRVRRIEVR